ncbi:MAG: amidohydrolase [Ardenticatenaceae bacterium]|nr:amidohydrolase [Ardenticatenaceae bacterium]MCB9003352.1 amidohydrolase [Ardenticatenaceae bacterium]
MGTILIRDGAVLTGGGWVEPGYVWVEAGRITAVSTTPPSPNILAQADEIIDAQYCAVMPGLVNAHTHLSQTFMRGLAGGRPLLPWLKERIWPLQAAFTPDDARLAAQLGLVENLRGGVTHVVNHHKVAASPAHTDAVCETAVASGLHVTIARSWTDKGVNAEPAAAILADLARLFARWQGAERLHIASGPLALWRCSADTLRRSHELARRYGSFTHFHVAESQDEVQLSLNEWGMRPVAWLHDIGMLAADTQVVHAVWVDEDEIRLLAQTGAPVVHCPVSNAVLGSGIAPVAALMQQGVPVKLGTDGPASNDTQDMWETMKTAVAFARASTLDATVLPPAAALNMALSADALHPGAPADLIVVNLNHARAMPVHDVASALALSTRGSDVQTVIVGGQILLRDGQVVGLDEAALLAECRRAVAALRQRAGLQ